jgi:hypothetical protein
MTQQTQREALALLMAALIFVRSVFPTPMINQATKEPYESQAKARLGLVAFGIFSLLVWYGIYREGR